MRNDAKSMILAMTVVLGACSTVGPASIREDRFDYGKAIGDSWKQQTLLNIVRLRYMDQPVFLEVSSVVAGYSLQAGVSVNGVVSSSNAVQGDYAALGGQAIYTERPTITYVPMTGEAFLRALITPIDPKNIFFMLQAGYAADFILALTVESLNGVHNSSTTGGIVREAGPEFMRALELIRDVQSAGGIGMRVEEDDAKSRTGFVFFRRDDVAPEVASKAAEIRRLLKLSAEQERFALTYSPVRGAENELAVNSRSMLQIMAAFSSYVDLPAAHVKDRSATPAVAESSPENPAHSVRVHSGTGKPADAFAAVLYRNHWFWIDHSDWQTKRALAAIMLFFTLMDTGPAEQLPLITIPAQ